MGFVCFFLVTPVTSYLFGTHPYNIIGLVLPFSFSNSWLLGGLNFLRVFKDDRLIGGSLQLCGQIFNGAH